MVLTKGWDKDKATRILAQATLPLEKLLADPIPLEEMQPLEKVTD
jgi:hypothetical protein